MTDWTLLTAEASRCVQYRGGAAGLLSAARRASQRSCLAATSRCCCRGATCRAHSSFVPYNVITTWYWVDAAATGNGGDSRAHRHGAVAAGAAAGWEVRPRRCWRRWTRTAMACSRQTRCAWTPQAKVDAVAPPRCGASGVANRRIAARVGAVRPAPQRGDRRVGGEAVRGMPCARQPHERAAGS